MSRVGIKWLLVCPYKPSSAFLNKENLPQRPIPFLLVPAFGFRVGFRLQDYATRVLKPQPVRAALLWDCEGFFGMEGLGSLVRAIVRLMLGIKDPILLQ